MNYFGSKTSAQRYAIGRPDFHAGTINRVKDFLGIENKASKALDIACGTGLSAKALLLIADEVYATDISEEMLNIAPKRERIHYQLAPAENQPFNDVELDLITVGSGVHWFDIDAFLTEANRLLKPGGWLVLYENYFPAEMPGDESLKGWMKEVYLPRFPSPPRNKNYAWTTENLQTKNFTIQIPENFINTVNFTKRQLVNYLTTQSNVIAAVESSRYTYEEVEQWLIDGLSPFFGKGENDIREIHYGNWIKYLQKI
jgi:ubiquinone/menaquinone biosynthesis C-methylase UbiE